jgi:hypothetical protein
MSLVDKNRNDFTVERPLDGDLFPEDRQMSQVAP